MPAAHGARSTTGDATYYGTLDQADTWTLVGDRQRRATRRARQRAGRAHGRAGRAALGSVARTAPTNNAVWNYVYVDDPTATHDARQLGRHQHPALHAREPRACRTPRRCRATRSRSAGRSTLYNTSHVGTTRRRRSHEVHVGGGCRLRHERAAFATPCGPAQRVYATISRRDPDRPSTKPPVDLAGWYYERAAGPDATAARPAASRAASTTTPSRTAAAAAVDLTPSTAYDCRVYDAQDNAGRPAHLEPGDATGHADDPRDDLLRRADRVPPTPTTRSTRAGRRSTPPATSPSRTSRPSAATPSCDADWDPHAEPARVRLRRRTCTVGEQSRRSRGRSTPSTTTPRTNNSTVWGPIIARRVSLANSSVNHYVPIGTLMPGMPATYEEVVTITNEPGSWG